MQQRSRQNKGTAYVECKSAVNCQKVLKHIDGGPINGPHIPAMPVFMLHAHNHRFPPQQEQQEKEWLKAAHLHRSRRILSKRGYGVGGGGRHMSPLPRTRSPAQMRSRNISRRRKSPARGGGRLKSRGSSWY